MRFMWFWLVMVLSVVLLGAIGGERARKNLQGFVGPAVVTVPREALGDKLENVVWSGCMQEVSFPEAPPGWSWSVVVTGADGVEREPNGVITDRYYVGDAKEVKVLLTPEAGGRGTPTVPVRKSEE
jgi:hypothetical protein